MKMRDSIVIKHLGEMQHQLNELKKRKGLNCDLEVQLDVKRMVLV
jgi:hypothetical protein